VRIGLVNNRYFMIGGTTRYVFNVQALLEEHGHEVVPFSNRYPETVDTPHVEHFVDPPGDPAAARYKDARVGPRRAWSLFRRSLYSKEVRRALEGVIDRHRLDLVYSVNICNFLGPSVIDAARSRGIPYVMRLSDFNLLCPSYHFFRDGHVCEECTGSLVHGIRHRCLQDSTAVSLARVLSMWGHRATGIYHRVTRMVTPSAFLRSRLREGGFDDVPIDHIPTFVQAERLPFVDDYTGDEVVYLGQLAEHKGVDVAVDALADLPADSRLRLVLLGKGEPSYVEMLRRRLPEELGHRLELPGFVNQEEAAQRTARALAVVMPARWYENMPNAVTEAMAMGRPVLASGLGSLPEQVLDGETGFLLSPDRPRDWAEALLRLDRDRDLARRLGQAGRDRALEEFSPLRHHDSLMDTFERARDAVAGR